MAASLAACALLILFFGATLATDALPRRLSWAPLLLLSLASFFGAMEIARYDHGHPGILLMVAHLAAPVVLIFGGAAWGTRRFYGWPDFGRHPPRAALVAGAIVLGALSGSRVWEDDVLESRARAEDLRTKVLAWKEAHGGRWPEALAMAVPDAPRTRLGLLDPPAFAYREEPDGRRTISFPVSRDRELVVGIEDGGWHQRNRSP